MRGDARDKAAIKLMAAAHTCQRSLLVRRSFAQSHPGVMEALRWCADLPRSKWKVTVSDSAACGSQDTLLDCLAASRRFLQGVRQLARRRGLDDMFFALPDA